MIGDYLEPGEEKYEDIPPEYVPDEPEHAIAFTEIEVQPGTSERVYVLVPVNAQTRQIAIPTEIAVEFNVERIGIAGKAHPDFDGDGRSCPAILFDEDCFYETTWEMGPYVAAAGETIDMIVRNHSNRPIVFRGKFLYDDLSKEQ